MNFLETFFRINLKGKKEERLKKGKKEKNESKGDSKNLSRQVATNNVHF